MKKKMVILLSALFCFSVFVSCSKAEPVEQYDFFSVYPSDGSEDTEVEEVFLDTYEEETQVDYSNLPFEWIERTNTVQDADGYKYEISIKISPWIFSSNESVLQNAWNEVGKDNTLPGFGDIYFPLSSNNTYQTDWLNDFDNDSSSQQGHRFTSYSTKDDFYYSVGQISVKNITDGWDIEESNPRTIRYTLGVQHSDPHNIQGLYVENSNAYSAMGRIFYSSRYEDTSAGILISPSLVKNTWGPVSFVLIAPESFSPNTPDGEYYEYWKDTKLKAGPPYISYSVYTEELENTIGDNTYLGIIDKNGEYYIPTER